MKKFFLIFFIFPNLLFSQSNWEIKYAKEKYFIENKGQFQVTAPGTFNNNIEFAYDGSAEDYYFTGSGIAFRFKRLVKKEKEDLLKKIERKKKSTAEEWRRHEIKEKRESVEEELVYAQWIGANKNVKIVPENKTQSYHSYTFKQNGKLTNVNHIKSFKKIIYKDLYPNIDVEYEFHPEGGIKYSVIVYPGGDISQVKLKYSSESFLQEDGNIYIKTKFDKIIEHAPITFYNGKKKELINSTYLLNNNIISFEIKDYNPSKTIIIDPWTETPFTNASNGVWECDHDALGNVYIFGDGMLDSEKLLKYNATGALQWTYTTAWDTSGNWLGTMATDLNGNSYITSGSVAEIEKVDNSGSMSWHNNGGAMDEYWAICFNCDQTKLIVGGTRLEGMPSITGKGVIFDINTSDGSVIDIADVGTCRPGPMGLTNVPMEVRSMTASYNSKYYYLTLDTIGAISQNFSLCGSVQPELFEIDHTYHFGYKSENFRPSNGNGSNMAIKANDSFVYTQDGETVHKRSLADGSIIGSAAIPGGNITTSLFGENSADNNGIDIDNCGNVYIGSSDRVIKYDSDLNLITSVNTTYKVSDVSVSTSGNVIICGTTGTTGSSNREGYVQSVSLSACEPITMICCDAVICPVEPMCDTDAPISLISGTPGTWSGDGVNPSTGLFDPSIAGIGTHVIVNTLPCGADSIVIEVMDCSPISVCVNDDTNLEASGGTGTGTISWCESSDTVYTILTEQQCIDCPTATPEYIMGFYTGCSETTCNASVWTAYATGHIASTPSTWPLLVTNGVDSLIFNSLSEIPDCAPCDVVIDSIVTADPFCGANNGEIIIYASGGVAPLQYSIDNGATFQSGNTFTGLGAGDYDIVVRDASPCDKHSQVTLTDLPGPIIDDSNIIITNADCGSSNGSITGITVSEGTPPLTYTWQDASGTSIGTNIDLNNIPAGNYTFIVTDANGCADTSTYSVNNIGGQTIDDSNIIITDANCGHSDGSITGITVSGGTPPYTYVWKDANNTTVGTNLDLTNVPAGSYTLTVTDSNTCIAMSGPHTINDIPGQTIDDNNISITIASCNESDGSITGITVSGGTPPYSYSWQDAGGTAAGTDINLNNVPAGTYILTVLDANACVASSGPYTISQDCKIDCLMDVPTGFSPNGDGRNDILYVKSFGIKEMEIMLFNREGEMVFQTSDMSEGWDGTYKGIIQETAVYIYYLTGTCLNGEKIEKKGNITLLN
jgi:gliding motility-associated-like protein